MLREIMFVQEVQFEQNKCAASLALDKARPMRHEYNLTSTNFTIYYFTLEVFALLMSDLPSNPF